jgi:hypothetical protein
MEVRRRHARTRAIIRDKVFPANQPDPGARHVSRAVARVVFHVSILCRAVLLILTTHAITSCTSLDRDRGCALLETDADLAQVYDDARHRHHRRRLSVREVDS